MRESRTFADFVLSPSGFISWLGGGLVVNILSGVIAMVWDTAVWQLGWVLSLVALLWGVYLARRRVEPKVLVPEEQQPRRYRGLVLLVGTGRPGEDPMSQSAGDAINYHIGAGAESGLEVCWLLASGGEKGSLPVALKLKEACEAKNIRAYTRTVGDAFSVQESYDLVRRIYEQEIPKAGLSEDEVIADYTGGVKPMTAGMVLACDDKRPMQYMYGRKKGIASVPRQVEFMRRRRR